MQNSKLTWVYVVVLFCRDVAKSYTLSSDLTCISVEDQCHFFSNQYNIHFEHVEGRRDLRVTLSHCRCNASPIFSLVTFSLRPR